MPGLTNIESLISKGEGAVHGVQSLLSMGLGRNDSMLGKAVGKLTKDKNLTGGKEELSKKLSKGDTITEARPMSALDQETSLRNQIAEQGTFSMLDVPLGLVRALPPVKKVLPQHKWDNMLYGYQSKLLNADRAGGEAVVKSLPFTNRLFTSNDMKPMLKVTTEAGDTVKGYVPVETQRLTAPLDKVKDFAAPFLGVLGVGSVYDSINGADSKKDKEGGKLLVNALSREDLIEKLSFQLPDFLGGGDVTLDSASNFINNKLGINHPAYRASAEEVARDLKRNPATLTENEWTGANTLAANPPVHRLETITLGEESVPEQDLLKGVVRMESDPVTRMPNPALSKGTLRDSSGLKDYTEVPDHSDHNSHPFKESATDTLGMEKNAAMLKAASMLKLASEKIATLSDANESLARDKADLTLLVTAKERSSRAVKLAKSMLHRGMLKQAEYDAQIDEIMEMDDRSYDILYNAIQSTPLLKSAAEISPWAFMIGVPDSTPERKSLDDAIIEASAGKKY